MNATEGGAFLFLLCHEWDEGSIPDDDTELEDIGRCDVATVRKVLSRCFRLTETGWVNDRLEDIRAEQVEKAEKASRAAAARWDKRYGEDASAMRPHTNAMPLDKKRGDKKRTEKRTTWRFVPDEWKPKAGHVELATALGVNLATEEQNFRDHEFKTPKTDADRAFSRWLRNAQAFAQPQRGGNASDRFRAKVDETAEYLRSRGIAS